MSIREAVELLEKVSKLDHDLILGKEAPVGMILAMMHKCADILINHRPEFKLCLEAFMSSVDVFVLMNLNDSNESNKDLN